jgi:predicted  nucleic acid-binding Zn-ribbon protein
MFEKIRGIISCRKELFLVLSVLLLVCFGVGRVFAAQRTQPIPLTPVGEKLKARYEAMLNALKAEIMKSLPKLDEGKFKAFHEAREAIKAAREKVYKLDEYKDRLGGLSHEIKVANQRIADADKGIGEAEAALKKATTEAERESARKELDKWQKEKEDALKTLKQRKEEFEKFKAQLEGEGLKADAEALNRAEQEAEDEWKWAMTKEYLAARAIIRDIEPFLASDKLDAKLVKAAVLAHATPQGLAEFAQESKEKEALVEELLSDTALMKQMLEAGGAQFGKYGRAMEIYREIQKASPRAKEGMFQRLALAIALEHAVPIKQKNAEMDTNAPAYVDPVKRYLHYEKAYLNGELDPAFKYLTVWEYRKVVDFINDAPDEILAWGREMLRNYRPDLVYTPDYNSRYVRIAYYEVEYKWGDWKYDFPMLNEYQNIPKDGGVCGRISFFGRFILRSFGMPTWGVTQPGHAAVGHWTPNGWVVFYGRGWEWSFWDREETDEAPRSGIDFYLETQARRHQDEYFKVLRAQWISRILGEQPFNDRTDVEGGIWSRVAHCMMVVLARKPVESSTINKEELKPIEPPDVEEKPFVNNAGIIVVPAATFSKATGGYIVMKSFLGGKQMHIAEGFSGEYEVEVPKEGKYAFYARVVTLQEGRKLLLSLNDEKTAVEIPVPYTIGMWQFTQPVELTLKKGMNIIRIGAKGGVPQPPHRGITIKDFMLVPLD